MSSRKTIQRMLLVLTLILVAPSTSFGQEVDYTIEIVSNDWNSLEIIKLLVGLLLPAALLFLGVWMDRRIKEFEHRQWSNQKVIEKRLEVYENITPRLNDMMCYFMRIGGWKEYDPTEIIDMKRETDRVAHIYAPLFSPAFMKLYNDYISLCFAMFRGAGKDAQLRADAANYRDAYVGDDNDQHRDWQKEWDDCFTGPEEAIDRHEVRQGYQNLVSLIAAELGVGSLTLQDRLDHLKDAIDA